jgi:hypothetical protein
MASSSDFANIPGMTKDMRDSVIAALDALSNWRHEVETANARCLGEVLDRTSAIARSMGWPDQTVSTIREYLGKTSKVQVEMTDQIMDGWEQQLKSATAQMAFPGTFTGQIPGAMPDVSAFAPWNLWLQAAEMWQRTWMPDTRSH